MLKKSGLSSAVLALSLAGLLSACSSTKPTTYQLERFDSSASPYSHTFKASSAATCYAARRALLSQGYTADSPKPDTVDGNKYFQPDSDSHVVIAFHVVCTSDYDGAKESTIYVSATQDRYALKKSSTSASVGLSVLGSISLPIGSSDDSLVKVSSETIPSVAFYDRYFGLVQHFVDEPAEAGPVPLPDNRLLEIPSKPANVAPVPAHPVQDTAAAPGVVPAKVAPEPAATVSPLPAASAAVSGNAATPASSAASNPVAPIAASAATPASVPAPTISTPAAPAAPAAATPTPAASAPAASVPAVSVPAISAPAVSAPAASAPASASTAASEAAPASATSAATGQ
jgi:hypothetical protein